MNILFEVLTPFVFTTHLILVNFASAAPLVCIWFEYRARAKNDLLLNSIGLEIAKQCVKWLTYGMLVGVLLGGLLWASDNRWFFDILFQQFPHKKLGYAVAEIIFYYACMGFYIYWWRHGRRDSLWQRIAHRFLAIMAVTNLLYHFPPLFASVAYIASHSDQWKDRTIDPATYRELIYRGEILAQTLHHWIAAVATAGVMLLGKSLKIAKQNNEAPHARSVAMQGAWIALIASALQFIVGLWFILEMSTGPRSLIMGQDMFGTVSFLLAMLAVFGLLHRLAAVAFGDYQRKDLIQCMALLFIVILLMTTTLQRSRLKLQGQLSLQSKNQIAERFELT